MTTQKRDRQSRPHRTKVRSVAPPVQLDGLSWLDSEQEAVKARTPLWARTVVDVAREGRRVELTSRATARLREGRSALELALDDGEAHYGINTGFGSFSRQRIPPGDLRDLQRNLIRSHAAGVGDPLPTELVRGMMLLLAASLSRGYSGVRPLVVQTLVEMLNRGVHPIVPSVGSCGASGDLAPLAHVILVSIGEGHAELNGRLLSGSAAMKQAKIQPLSLEAKEGLALINGTHLMAASAALLTHDFDRLLEAAIIAAAASIDACRATDAFLDDRVHELRGQVGQVYVAERIRGLLKGSRILPSHRDNDPRVQDPYSLRCSPQVLGAVVDAADYAGEAFITELLAVTDNPLVFSRRNRYGKAATDIVSAGNFHGMPLAIPLDTLAIAICHLAGISERRIYHMLSAFDTDAGLAPYLSPKPGLHSGLMIAQYTAAACCNELIGLATPASVANLSTSAGMEDYNSWGPRAATKARRSLDLAISVVAVELICASEAIERHRPLRSSPAIEKIVSTVRRQVPRLVADRPPAPDIAAVAAMITRGEIAEA
ncbi:MAG: histidine ammonia-lyase [Phycisphaerales bacterium]